MRIRSFAAATVLAAAAVLGTAASSYAGTATAASSDSTWVWPMGWGTFSFQAYGDQVGISDDTADGYGVIATVKTSSGALQYSVEDLGGKGTSESRSASWGGKYDLKEGATYKFTFCKVKDGVTSSCISGSAQA